MSPATIASVQLLAPGWTGLEWLRPDQALWALAAVPLVALGVAGLVRSRAALRALLSPSMRRAAAAEPSRGRRLLRVSLAAVALVAAAVGLAGPVLGFIERPVLNRSVDLVLCIDTSRSMLARDVRPDRLERARREITGLFEAAPGNRFALVGFSGDARQVAPLSNDRRALAELLARVTVDDNRRGGTDLGAALERGLELLDPGSAASQAIVLLTDGEDLEGRGLAVAQRAAERGVRVFVVGVGTARGSKIPTIGPDGVERFLVGPDGVEVQTRLEGESLRALAEATGGAYLSTESSPTPLEDLFEQRVAELDVREVTDGVRRVPRDRYQWPLALALLLVMAESGLRERRRA